MVQEASVLAGFCQIVFVLVFRLVTNVDDLMAPANRPDRHGYAANGAAVWANMVTVMTMLGRLWLWHACT